MRFKFLRSKVLYLFFLSAIYIIDVIHNKLLVYFPPLQKILIFSSVVFLSSAILFFLCKFFLKEKQKAGIASLLLLFFVFYYFDIYYSLFGISGISKIISGFLFSKFHIVLTGIMTTIFIAAYSFLKRTKKNLSALTSYLNIVFFLFLIFEVYKLIAFPPDKIYRTENKNLQGKADVKRNIYYVVLDSYTSSLSLKKYWHYDNELEIFLKSKGLFIAEKSKCNYNSTPFSLASSLNISYLSLENYKQAQNTQAENIFDLVKNNPVVKSFSENGYEIKNLSFFDLGNSSPYYPDVFYKKENLFDRSIFFLFSEKLHITHEHDQLLNLAKTNLDIFSQLESLPEKPTFYYAHLMMPHYPYFFDSTGKVMNEQYARTEENRKEKYLEQLKFTNRLLMDAIEKILSQSKLSPIIIIQGDHGFRDLQEDGLEESKTILNAYYFPGDTLKNSLYDSISPVNSFRILFNTYFKTNLPLLPDKFTNTELKE